MNRHRFILMSFLIGIFIIFMINLVIGKNKNDKRNGKEMKNANKYEVATFGGGCFWCVEAVFEKLKGVHSVINGYAGGHTEYPSYEEVCSGTTGHAEVCQITYDPAVISYQELLEVFFSTHDPTTINQQGADVGSQYRSIILYHNEKQRKLAEQYKNELNRSGVFGRPVVTEIVPLKKFYPAEDYHQDYYEKHPNQPYCAFVINPKLEKFKKKFREKLKE